MDMVNGLHLYSAFIQSAVQCMPLIHPFTHTFTHQRRLAAMQGTNQLVRSNWGLGVLLRDTSTHPGWDRTGNPPTARRQLYLLSYIAPYTTAKKHLYITPNAISYKTTLQPHFGLQTHPNTWNKINKTGKRGDWYCGDDKGLIIAHFIAVNGITF